MKRFLTLFVGSLLFTVNAYAQCQLGDVNGDGHVSGIDATLAARIAVGLQIGTPCQMISADVDKNGVVNRGDSLLIASYAAGILHELPAKIGDVNMDGSLSGIDAVLVARYVAGLSTLNDTQKYLADVDQNGIIDSRDSQLIAQAAAGLISLPIPVPSRLAMPQ